jgi:hypothetical protein
MVGYQTLRRSRALLTIGVKVERMLHKKAPTKGQALVVEVLLLTQLGIIFGGVVALLAWLVLDIFL